MKLSATAKEAPCCRYAPATINLRLGAVRRIAYEAADANLLIPELAAGIRRVKGGDGSACASGTG